MDEQEALLEALKDKRSRGLKGAGLDVFATEPLPLDSELWKLDNHAAIWNDEPEL